MDLQVGQLITAPFLPASAQVKKFEPRSGYYLLEVVLQDGHHTYKPLRITDDQLAQVQILEQHRVASNNTSYMLYSAVTQNGGVIWRIL
jgi:hypothetical protein